MPRRQQVTEAGGNHSLKFQIQAVLSAWLGATEGISASTYHM
jgi:hypothetical protein